MLGEIIGFMAEDRSNDWSEEVVTLEAIETGMDALRHALAVAEYKADHTDAEGFLIMGSVDRGEFLIEAVRAFLKDS